MRRLFAVLSMCAIITACGTFRANESALTIGVTYAIQRYVYEKPADQQEATKERIRTIAGDLKVLASGDAVSLPLLRLALDTQLDRANLIPQDRALIAAVADAVVLELTKRVGDGVISPDELYEVVQVLELVERAAA